MTFNESEMLLYRRWRIEVESNVKNLQNIELESDEKIVKDNPIKQNLSADYQLPIDRKTRPHMEL